jgi:hypothetical protein
VWAQWLLLILYAGVGLTNVLRGLLGLVVSPVIAAEAPALAWLSVVYLGWGAIFIGVCVARLAGAGSRCPWPVLGAAVLYQASVWVIKLVAQPASYSRYLWPRDLLLTIMFLSIVLLLCRIAAQSSRRQRK